MQTYKQFQRRVAVLISLDVLVLALLVWWIDATPDVSIAELLIVPVIFFINLIIAAVVHFIRRYRSFTNAFIVNSIIACIIFHYLFGAWFIYYDNLHFVRYYFKQEGKQYELLLDQRDTSYTIDEQLNGGSAMQLKHGVYRGSGKNIILADSTNQMYIYNHQLIGYPHGSERVILNDSKRGE